jgi:hypothetical protein
LALPVDKISNILSQIWQSGVDRLASPVFDSNALDTGSQFVLSLSHGPSVPAQKLLSLALSSLAQALDNFRHEQPTSVALESGCTVLQRLANVLSQVHAVSNGQPSNRLSIAVQL